MDFPGRFSTTAVGIACGAGAAVFWAAGFVVARHGIDVGFFPSDLTFHRCFWAGLLLMPLAWRDGIGDLNGIGWSRGILLTILGGPGFVLISYLGFPLAPLGHAGVIQPSSAALFGLLLATVVLGEQLPLLRAIGALTIVAGLAVVGGEAITTIGVRCVVGDLMFVLAGGFFATFSVLLRLWSVAPMPAAIVVGVVSLAMLPIYWVLIGFDRMAALGAWENLLQALLLGILAGPAAIYLFTHSVVVLGAGRASVFPSLIPPCVLLIGWLALGEIPSIMQFAGLAIVLVGFRLAQRG